MGDAFNVVDRYAVKKEFFGRSETEFPIQVSFYAIFELANNIQAQSVNVVVGVNDCVGIRRWVADFFMRMQQFSVAVGFLGVVWPGLKDGRFSEDSLLQRAGEFEIVDMPVPVTNLPENLKSICILTSTASVFPWFSECQRHYLATKKLRLLWNCSSEKSILTLEWNRMILLLPRDTAPGDTAIAYPEYRYFQCPTTPLGANARQTYSVVRHSATIQLLGRPLRDQEA